jgi:hypothetical protein
MKKLLLSSLFVIAGTVLFAQAPAKTSAAPAATNAAPAAPLVEETMKADAAVSVTEEKKEAKKECLSDEKKACNSKSAKKACCSSKAEAKNEK